VYTGRAGHSTIDMFLKGIDRILYVLGEVKNAHPVGLFHLASKNKELLYATMLRDRGIDYHFNIQNSELQHYLRAGDIYIHTSRYESCSLSLMEAMASGLVPVSFPAGMAPIQIQNGVNGYIVNSVEEMVQCVQELITDPEKRTSLGAAATETIRAEYSIEKMVSGYIASFERLLS